MRFRRSLCTLNANLTRPGRDVWLQYVRRQCRFRGGIGGQAKSLGGFTYSFLKCGGGSLYLTVSKVAEGSAFVYRFDEAAYRAAAEAGS